MRLKIDPRAVGRRTPRHGLGLGPSLPVEVLQKRRRDEADTGRMGGTLIVTVTAWWLLRYNLSSNTARIKSNNSSRNSDLFERSQFVSSTECVVFRYSSFAWVNSENKSSNSFAACTF
jgi:hypothetical protein